jgi:hypothetical protein
MSNPPDIQLPINLTIDTAAAQFADDLVQTISLIKKINTHVVPTISLQEVTRHFKLLSPLRDRVRILQYSAVPISILFMSVICVVCLKCHKKHLCCGKNMTEDSTNPKEMHPIQIFNAPQSINQNSTAVTLSEAPLFPSLADCV